MSETVRESAKKPESTKEDRTSKTQQSEYSQPVTSSVDRILFLQRTIGNQAVGRLIKSGALHAKLTIGQQPDDIYEQEANRVADQVMRMVDEDKPKPDIQTNLISGGITPLVYRQPDIGDAEANEVASDLTSSLGAGETLDTASRTYFEPRFGNDFGNVRIHHGPQADSAAASVQARAFTLGRDVVFAAGEHDPGSEGGKRLLAHELTHVVQQSGSDGITVGQSHEKRGLSRTACSISRLPLRIMRMDWSADMRSQRMPPCGTPAHEAFPFEVAALGNVPNGARTNCLYTPLFHVPQFRLPDGRHRITVHARVSPAPVRCADRYWSINVYECFSDGSSLAVGCDPDHDDSYAGGLILSDPLKVTYPSRGDSGLWSTRNLSVRVSNGCTVPIPVSLSVEYPSMPEPTAWEQISEGLHMMLSALGLTEPFGFFFDGVDAVIYASEGEWLQAGLSIGASIPLAGGAVALRRMIRRDGREVIGMAIRREALPMLRSEDVAAALRRARTRSRGPHTVPEVPRHPPEQRRGSESAPPAETAPPQHRREESWLRPETWNQGWGHRGLMAEHVVIAQRLGQDAVELPARFPTYDAVVGGAQTRRTEMINGMMTEIIEIEGGTAYSVKSVDMRVTSFQTANGVLSHLNSYVTQIIRFPAGGAQRSERFGDRWFRVSLRDPIARVLHFEVNMPLTSQQVDGFRQLAALCDDNGILLQVFGPEGRILLH